MSKKSSDTSIDTKSTHTSDTSNPDVNTAAVIGLGLIGGSLAKALRDRVRIPKIIGVDVSTKSIDDALQSGVIDEGFSQIDERIRECGIVFLCTPLSKSLEMLEQLNGILQPGCMVTDVCSTKSEIISRVNSLHVEYDFIGGHPMAGSEKTGFQASRSHLFENAYYILTPCARTSEEALATMKEIVAKMGSIPLVLGAEEHDMAAGAISHVPHVVAAALVNLVHSLEFGSNTLQRLAAGGFKDITRIASSNPEMWETITLSNRNQIAAILHKYIRSLEDITARIEKKDRESIYRFFEEARDFRSSFSDRQTGLLPPVWDLIVDVVDRPGIIGKIATLLGENDVNIRNIHVLSSREFEQGCLRITFPDLPGMEHAFTLLSAEGYRVYRIGKDGMA